MATKTDGATDKPSYRQRSNSDPQPAVDALNALNTDKAEETWTTNTIGRSEYSRRNGELKSGSHVTNTPPPERKSKFAALGKIFKPWKWRRKKKSEKIEKTAVDLERKISMRTSREELIRKGVLREPEEQNHVPKIETVKESSEEGTGETGNSSTANQNQTSEDGAAVSVSNSTTTSDTVTTTSSSIATEGVTATEPQASSTSSTITTQAEITPASSINTTVSSSASVRPVVVAPSTVASMELIQPPPPSYPPPPGEATHNSLVHFNDRVQRIIPAAADEDDEEEVEAYSEDPAPALPAYEQIPASEPDLSLKPSKSALKLKNGQAPPMIAPKPMISHAKTSSLTRPMNTTPVGAAGEPRVSPKAVQQPVIQSALRTKVSVTTDANKENIPLKVSSAEAAANAHALATSLHEQQQADYDNIPGDDDSSDEEIHYKDDDEGGLAAKVARQDSLARFLNNRPSRKELMEKNIIPNKSENEKQTDREAIGTKLTRRLSLRPTPEELEQRNILYHQTNEEREMDKEEKKRYLIRKLSFRPSIEELRERKIIKFNDYVEVTDAEMYDRRADKPWTRLTPKDKAAIRKELNEFKSKEMEVHEESKHLTRFHRP